MEDVPEGAQAVVLPVATLDEEQSATETPLELARVGSTRGPFGRRWFI